LSGKVVCPKDSKNDSESHSVSAAKPCKRALCVILAVMLAIAKMLHAYRGTHDKL